MAVIYICVYCGKKIKSDLIFEGPIKNFDEFVKEKTRRLSEKCSCRKNYMNDTLKKFSRNNK